jgi:hypothetical protein
VKRDIARAIISNLVLQLRTIVRKCGIILQDTLSLYGEKDETDGLGHQFYDHSSIIVIIQRRVHDIIVPTTASTFFKY